MLVATKATAAPDAAHNQHFLYAGDWTSQKVAGDTSALMAILRDEPETNVCAAALEAADRLLISAGTVAEASIVARRRAVGEEVARLIDGLGLEIVSVTPASARCIAAAYENRGKGVYRAALISREL